MAGSGPRVRFCNNPGCPRADEHLRPGEALRRGDRELCPVCHEELVIREARPRPPRWSGARRPGGRRTWADQRGQARGRPGPQVARAAGKEDR